MCGIVGISCKTVSANSKSLATDDLEDLTGRHLFAGLDSALIDLAHRGPDDSGVFKESKSGIGLGHRRLSILDPSPLAHQPMFSDDGKVVLVFNGEIFNFSDKMDCITQLSLNID
jgi:asparagine synthetase B (glutamine-hydrolysing)